MYVDENDLKESKELDGRDLMYFLLDLHKVGKIDGDSIVTFLTDAVDRDGYGDSRVRDFIKEESEGL